MSLETIIGWYAGYIWSFLSLNVSRDIFLALSLIKPLENKTQLVIELYYYFEIG